MLISNLLLQFVKMSSFFVAKSYNIKHDKKLQKTKNSEDYLFFIVMFYRTKKISPLF